MTSRARDVIPARANMTFVARALFVSHIHAPIRLLCLVFLCTFVYVRMYVPVCILWSDLFPFIALVCDLLPRRLLSWLGQRCIARRVSQGDNIVSANFIHVSGV